MGSVYWLDTGCLSAPGLCDAVSRGLSAHRREKAGRCYFAKDRRLCLGAGAVLDAALARLGLREREAELAYGPQGKPALAGCPGVFFNLSHSGTLAVCAISTAEVGVDVEAPREAGEALIRRVCTPREAGELLALPPEERRSRFCRLWTVKESYMKLLGAGLSLPPAALDVRVDDAVSLWRDGVRQEAFFSQWEVKGSPLTVCNAAPEGYQLWELTGEALAERYG